MANSATTPPQQAVRIRQPDALHEEQTDPTRIKRHGEDGVGCPVVRTESNGKGVVLDAELFGGSRFPAGSHWNFPLHSDHVDHLA